MNYERIVCEILNIGEALLQCGAETFRVDDSIYRLGRAYGFRQVDVFAIPSNIQITVETQDGKFITQIRHIESVSNDYDKLDKLNNLSRFACAHTPGEEELHERFEGIMNSPSQPPIIGYAANVVGGTSFGIFFGCDFFDAIVAALLSLMIVCVGKQLSKRENNLLIYNSILAFLGEAAILLLTAAGVVLHTESIMIGIVMLLISAIATTNGIRDILQRDYISGAINIMNSILGAGGIAVGIALAMLIMGDIQPAGADGLGADNAIVKLISCTVGCIAFALGFKVKGRLVIYSGIGAFLTWLIFIFISHYISSAFIATLGGSIFVAFYAFVMSRINKAPSTIFLTASVLPLIPGSNLYYLMYGFVIQDFELVQAQSIVLFSTCLGIAFGFLVVDFMSRAIMYELKKEYHIGKNSILIK